LQLSERDCPSDRQGVQPPRHDGECIKHQCENQPAGRWFRAVALPQFLLAPGGESTQSKTESKRSRAGIARSAFSKRPIAIRMKSTAVALAAAASIAAASARATSISVCRDATYEVAADRGAPCSGVGAAPAGSACPRKGDVAVSGCYDYLASYSAEAGGCVAPESAVCAVLLGSTWGCVLPSVGCFEPLVTEEPVEEDTACETWDFDGDDVVVDLATFDGMESYGYTTTWFVEETSVTTLYDCGEAPATETPSTPSPVSAVPVAPATNPPVTVTPRPQTSAPPTAKPPTQAPTTTTPATTKPPTQPPATEPPTEPPTTEPPTEAPTTVPPPVVTTPPPPVTTGPPPVYGATTAPPPVVTTPPPPATTEPPEYGITTPPPVVTTAPPPVYGATTAPPPVYAATTAPPPVYAATTAPPPVYAATPPTSAPTTEAPTTAPTAHYGP
jgi:hypothetical protein